jgi:hypothetical protein
MKVLLLSEGPPSRKMSVAVRLDKDIVTQGNNDAQALDRLQKAILAEDFWEKRDSEEGKPTCKVGPPPVIYAKLYGLSAIWDGPGPKDWEIRVWRGTSPYQWSVSKRFTKKKPS